MLRKLMKHEFRATGRIMLPLFLVVLVTAVGANISTRGLMEVENDFLDVLGFLLLTAFTLAIVSVCLVAFGLMIQRFHKNLLRDEGYVMMTLPVSVRQHVWSKLLVSMVWFVATIVVVVLAFLILVFEVGAVQQFFAGVSDLLRELRLSDYTMCLGIFALELVVLLFFSCAGACLQIYAAMAIGHSFANHKVIWSVGVYFASQFALQLLGGGLIEIMDETGLDYVLTQAVQRSSSPIAATTAMMLVLIVIAVLFAALFYFLTTYFLKKRLNLE